MKTKEIIDYLECKAPLFLQEDYDNSGLQWGDPEQEVKKVLVCLDLTREALNTAILEKADMIVSHHPILFKPMKSIHTGTGTGAMLADCIRNNICVYASHTNYDTAENSLNDTLAMELGLLNIEGLKPHHKEPLYKLIVYIPEDSLEKVQNAVFEAGAGWVGNYSHCGFTVNGSGTFKPREGTRPYIGQTGKFEKVSEYRFETIVPQGRLKDVINSMLKAHPYEEVAYDIFRMERSGHEYALGRVGNLKEKLSGIGFADYVKDRLRAPFVRVVGSPETVTIGKVAVFCGSFDGDVKALQAKNVDALVTGDLKYHDAQALEQSGIFTVDAGHYHTEKLFIPAISEVLKKQFNDVIIIEHYGQDVFLLR